MQVEIQIDSQYKEPKVVVFADRITEELTAVIRKLSEDVPQMLAGFRDGVLEILNPASVIRIYAASGKVYAVTDAGEFTIRLRLYELEDRLDKRSFVRISNSEIINLRKVKSFDLSLAGTICVSFSNGTAAYVSRRYVSKIKQVLGI